VYARGVRLCQLDTIGLKGVAKFWFSNPFFENDDFKSLIDVESANTPNRRRGLNEDFQVDLPTLSRSTYHSFRRHL
jgi:hypothetical protein